MHENCNFFFKPKLLDDYLEMGGEEEEQHWSSGDDLLTPYFAIHIQPYMEGKRVISH